MISLKASNYKFLSKRGVALICLTVFLCIIAILMLSSASSYSAEKNFNDSLYFVKKQLIAMGLGLICMIVLSYTNSKLVKKVTIPFLILSFILLVIIFIPGVGVESFGAKRWINLGFTTIQPSELSKFALIIFSAKFMENRDMNKIRNCIPILMVGGLMCVLLLLEPNMSVTILSAALMIIMLYIGGANSKLFIAMVIPIVIAFVLLIVTEPYRLQRLMAFINPWANPRGEGYQLIQSYYALGSGGWFGVGLFNSRQKFLFLPFAESDFIFSIVGEELGFIGALFIISIYASITVLGISISKRCENRFDATLAFGISNVFGLQTLLNIAVVSGAIPPTGIPLPLMSYGGSSLVCFLSSIGILLSVDRRSKVNIFSVIEEKREGKKKYGRLRFN